MDGHIKISPRLLLFLFTLFQCHLLLPSHISIYMESLEINRQIVQTFLFTFCLDLLIDWLVNLHSKSLDNIAFIMDNASIHKTQAVSKYSINLKIHLISIPSYSPWLNHAETFIRAIKARSKQKWRNGR